MSLSPSDEVVMRSSPSDEVVMSSSPSAQVVASSSSTDEVVMRAHRRVVRWSWGHRRVLRWSWDHRRVLRWSWDHRRVLRWSWDHRRVTVKAILLLGLVTFAAAPLAQLFLCCVTIFALSFAELHRWFLALKFRALPSTSTIKLIKIIRIMNESVVLIFASVPGLLPETMSWWHEVVQCPYHTQQHYANNAQIKQLFFPHPFCRRHW